MSTVDLLVTISQISGTVIAVNAGFVTSKILSLSIEHGRSVALIRKTNSEMLATMKKLDYTSLDIINGAKRPQELDKFHMELASITDSLDMSSDSEGTRRILKSLIPLLILGIVLPILYLAFWVDSMGNIETIFLVAGFFLGLFILLGNLFYQIISIHKRC